MSDSEYACSAAVGLLGVAAFIALVIRPGGFEGQIGYFFAFLPGANIAAFIFRPPFPAWTTTRPGLATSVYWVFVIGGSLIWYFALALAAIKGYRFVVRFLGRA